MLILVGLLAALTACAGLLTPVPTREEVLGSWEAVDDGHRTSIQLHGDGTIRIASVPRAVLERDATDTLDWDDTVDLNGTWVFSEGSEEAYDEPLISVTLDQASGGQWLTLYPRGGGLHLYYGDVELSRHLFFELTEAPSTPSPETISQDDLVGEWRSESGSVLTLSADGSFAIDDAPSAFITHTDQDGTQTPLTPTGRWSFQESTLPLDPATDVQLSFEGTYGALDSFVTTFVTLTEDQGMLSLSFHDEVRWEKG